MMVSTELGYRLTARAARLQDRVESQVLALGVSGPEDKPTATDFESRPDPYTLGDGKLRTDLFEGSDNPLGRRRKGHVYFFQAVGENLCKIGRTSKSPQGRRKGLTGCPYALELLGCSKRLTPLMPNVLSTTI